MTPTLYDRVLEVARRYMGPAAEDYIRRRIRIVLLGQDPETIAFENLPRLVSGIEMTAKVYMGEERAARFCVDIARLHKL
jgi:hypothetical protein